MRFLHLLRHAKSSWKESGLDDFDRPLKDRGIRACEGIAAYMGRNRIEPDLVLCSSALRARQTLRGIEDHLARRWPTAFDDDLYLATTAQILARIRKVDDAVRALLVIGHNPGLAHLAHDLAGSGEAAAMAAMAERFPTAALAGFEVRAPRWSEAGRGSVRLCAFATPKSIAS